MVEIYGAYDTERMNLVFSALIITAFSVLLIPFWQVLVVVIIYYVIALLIVGTVDRIERSVSIKSGIKLEKCGVRMEHYDHSIFIEE